VDERDADSRERVRRNNRDQSNTKHQNISKDNGHKALRVSSPVAGNPAREGGWVGEREDNGGRADEGGQRPLGARARRSERDRDRDNAGSKGGGILGIQREADKDAVAVGAEGLCDVGRTKKGREEGVGGDLSSPQVGLVCALAPGQLKAEEGWRRQRARERERKRERERERERNLFYFSHYCLLYSQERGGSDRVQRST
jgi:hypothetical protein